MKHLLFVEDDLSLIPISEKVRKRPETPEQDDDPMHLQSAAKASDAIPQILPAGGSFQGGGAG